MKLKNRKEKRKLDYQRFKVSKAAKESLKKARCCKHIVSNSFY